MTDITGIKYAALLVFLTAAFPVVLLVQIILRIAGGVLFTVEDALLSLSDPKGTRLYRWLGWGQ